MGQGNVFVRERENVAVIEQHSSDDTHHNFDATHTWECNLRVGS